jgi:hypothetical protein
MVNPRRVVVSRNTKKAGNQPLKFHKAERLHVSAIAAGMVHSTAITEDGLIFYWMSGDPNLHTHQLISMTGHQAVAVAAGKFRTAVATSAGSIYAWDGEGIKGDSSPVPVRVHGIKHATSVSVGESHSLSIAALYVPIYSSKVVEPLVKGKGLLDGEESLDEDFDMDDNLGCPEPMGIITGPAATEGVPSLKDLCQKVIAEAVLEPKNALQLLEVADGLGADHLRRHCEVNPITSIYDQVVDVWSGAMMCCCWRFLILQALAEVLCLLVLKSKSCVEICLAISFCIALVLYHSYL